MSYSCGTREGSPTSAAGWALSASSVQLCSAVPAGAKTCLKPMPRTGQIRPKDKEQTC
jgi:hypothetical protein